MADELNLKGNENYERQRNAVAYLLERCGAALDMEYGCNSSTASTKDVRSALVNGYNYSKKASYKYRDNHRTKTWKSLIRKNIDKGWPIIYRGTKTSNGKGHSFVCDGYNDKDEFHFNFGWAQSDKNRYLTLSKINPINNEEAIDEDEIIDDGEEGIDEDESVDGNGYNSDQAALFYIYPKYEHNVCNSVLNVDYYYSYMFINPWFNPGMVPKTMMRLISADANSPNGLNVIAAGSTVEYAAHDEIVLQPGFTVERGAEFTATVTPCEMCESAAQSRASMAMANAIGTIPLSESRISEMQVIEDTTVGLDDALKVYPNPFTSVLNVEMELAEGTDVQIVVYDDRKNVVAHSRHSDVEAGTFRTALQLPSLPQGLYYVQVITEEDVSVRKLMKR